MTPLAQIKASDSDHRGILTNASHEAIAFMTSKRGLISTRYEQLMAPILRMESKLAEKIPQDLASLGESLDAHNVSLSEMWGSDIGNKTEMADLLNESQQLLQEYESASELVYGRKRGKWRRALALTVIVLSLFS